MTSLVEAKSLSALTTLASNPPQYPRNPTHQSHEPLVLYIERVPGSKDVFLTPMKPREKVVTAEDVQSSLYYLHFDAPEDDYIRGLGIENEPQANEQAAKLPGFDSASITRKPLRKPLPSLPVDDAPTLALPSPNSLRRKPVSGTPPLSIKVDTGNSSRAHLHRPIRPTFPANWTSGTHRRGQSTELLSPQQENLRPSIPNRRWSAQPPLRGHSPTKPKAELPIWMQDQPRRQKSPTKAPESPCSPTPSFTRRDSGLFSPSPTVPGRGLSITLIRRDPASGAQWNVGKVKDPPSFEIYSDGLGRPVQERVNKPGAPLYIDISNPGYSKFLANSSPSSPRRSGESVSSSRSSFTTSRTPVQSPTCSIDTTFRRRVWYEGARYATDYFGHKKLMPNDSNLTILGTRPFGDRSPRDETDSLRRISLGPQERKPGYRGYVFESPWNGRCEFVTGGAGDALKCRHSLPSISAASPAPEVVTVSELRFNLPATRSQPACIEERGSMRTSFLNRHYASSFRSVGPSADEILGGVANLDLSLGLEYAGGGFGGKQAKLGKLIIRDEGLKMMDLLVAANMSLWCRAYEKVEAAGWARHDTRCNTNDVA